MSFRVTNIIDGNTIEVAGWQWQNVSGTKVKILGYTVNDDQYDRLAKSRLITLLLNKEVDLRNATKIEHRETPAEATIYCAVFLNEVDISNYFPELKQKQQS